MKTEMTALMAKAIIRRAAGLPCNPRRVGADDVDWLTHDEIDRAQCLTLGIAIASRQAICSAVAVSNTLAGCELTA